MQIIRPVQEVKQRCQSQLLAPVRDFLDVFRRDNNEVIFHDPLAAAVIFQPQLCQFERGRVDVELTGSSRAIGMTHWNPRPRKQDPVKADPTSPDVEVQYPHEVAITVNAPAFLDHYFAICNAQK
jgi:purine nucleosidase